MSNNKEYIGSSVDIRRRIRHHVRALSKNLHINIKLQRAWNKYGKDNFDVRVLELCDDLIRKEQYYIDTFHPEYNIVLVVEGRFTYPKNVTDKRNELLKKLYNTPKMKKLFSDKSKEMWRNPAHRDLMSKFAKSDEEHTRRRNNMLRIWKDPEYRKQHSESLYGKGNSKLSPKDVRKIRKLHADGVGSPTICKMFNLKSTRSVFRILQGITYKWVK